MPETPSPLRKKYRLAKIFERVALAGTLIASGYTAVHGIQADHEKADICAQRMEEKKTCTPENKAAHDHRKKSLGGFMLVGIGLAGSLFTARRAERLRKQVNKKL